MHFTEKRRWSSLAAVVMAVGGLLLAGPRVRAAESNNEARLRDALRAATAQVVGLEDEKARLVAASDAQKKEIEDLRAKLAVAVRPVVRPAIATCPDTNTREVASLNERLSQVVDSRAKLNENLTQCQSSLRDAAQASRAKEEERAQLAEKMGPLTERLNVCESKNGKMFGVAKEILSRYENVSLGDVIRAREPFLGLMRVELENLAQDYEDRLLDQKVTN